jgi:hypothetical protein
VHADDKDRIAYLAKEQVASLSASERVALDELRELLAAPAIWEQPPDELEDRVVAAVSTEARARLAAGQGRARPGWWRPALRRPVIALGSLAAAAAVAAVIVVAASTGGPGPERFAMVVEGTPLARAAHGSATLTKTNSGWRIQLSATGLPHLANGRYYQAWLKNAAGILVPVGTFNDARSVTLWSGVPVTEFRMLTVTRQLADGDPASSGQRVLIGTIVARH